MKSKQIFFFSTLNDIKPIIEEIEILISVKYYLTGMFKSRNIAEYDSFFKVPGGGQTNSGDWNRNDDYIIIPGNLMLNIRDIPQKKGGIMYAVDQLHNSKSIVIKLGGVYTGVPRVLIAGRAGTVSEEDISLELFGLLASKIKKGFKKRIEGFYIGPEAQQLLKDGWRLVTDEERPQEYDLKFE